MITLEDYLMGREAKSPIDEDVQWNAKVTVERVNVLLQAFGEHRRVTSGYRPVSTNRNQGGSPGSKHITCQAVDIEDDDGRFGKWCMENLPWLVTLGLWMESTRYTVKRDSQKKIRRWVHLQTVAPKSGNRVFIPYAGPPPCINA